MIIFIMTAMNPNRPTTGRGRGRAKAPPTAQTPRPGSEHVQTAQHPGQVKI